MTHKRFTPSGCFAHRLRPARILPWVVLATALAGGSAAAQSANPPPNGSDGGSLDGLLQALDLKPKPTQAPDFVRASRPDAAHSDFLPLGRAHPDRPVKVMTPAEIQATTEALDGSRMAQQRRAGIKPPPVPLKKPKDAAEPASKTSLR